MDIGRIQLTEIFRNRSIGLELNFRGVVVAVR